MTHCLITLLHTRQYSPLTLKYVLDNDVEKQEALETIIARLDEILPMFFSFWESVNSVHITEPFVAPFAFQAIPFHLLMRTWSTPINKSSLTVRSSQIALWCIQSPCGLDLGGGRDNMTVDVSHCLWREVEAVASATRAPFCTVGSKTSVPGELQRRSGGHSCATNVSAVVKICKSEYISWEIVIYSLFSLFCTISHNVNIWLYVEWHKLGHGESIAGMVTSAPAYLLYNRRWVWGDANLSHDVFVF